MQLILGPPGAGKTVICLQRLRKALRAGSDSCRLIVPTATMAEHLRNELAREGFVFKPAVVSTFTKFLEPYMTATPGVPAGILEILVGEALARTPLARYTKVLEFGGFRRSVVQVIEEFLSAGGSIEDLERVDADPDFVRVLRATQDALRQRTLHLRAYQLRAASLKIAEQGCSGVTEVILSGFYSFTGPETEVVRALAGRIDVTLALAEWPGAQPTLDALSPIITSTERMAPAPLSLNRTLCVAPTLDVEVSEIARRVLAAHDNGYAWLDIGVIVRSEPTYVPALRSAFVRFGVPARFYFSSPLNEAPAVRYFRALVEALLSGWDYLLTLRALRLPGSRIERGASGDHFEFTVLERAPGAGLDGLRRLAGDRVQGLLTELEPLSAWSSGKAFPQTWAVRMKALRRFFAPIDAQEGISAEIALLWRSHAAAMDAFDTACASAASALDPGTPISLETYWKAAETVLAASELRVPDHRRDVVHVIDAFEARQWKLPIVFICGLLEKEFPKYHSEDAILPDPVRRRLQTAGIQVRTSEQRQADERFLFDLALSRGRDAVVLSYPQLNAKGEANLPSFFLPHARPFTEDRAADARPHAIRDRSLEPAPAILTEEGRQRLAARQKHFTPTGIETYLQCPYQFFAQRTLNLTGRPEAAWERLNVLVQGSIVHDVLERSSRERQPVRVIFDKVFAAHCAEANVPEGYRTEAIRLELLHNLELVEADVRLPIGDVSYYEEPFSLELTPGAVLKGKIDRIEVDANGNATVIDYKYRSKTGTEKTKKGHDEKTHVQGGLYLIAAQEKGLQPAGMIYCGFRREVCFAGWMLPAQYPEVRQQCEPEELKSLIEQARHDSLEAIAGIREGRIDPKPADEMKCEYCEMAHTCRYEVAAMEQAQRAGR